MTTVLRGSAAFAVSTLAGVAVQYDMHAKILISQTVTVLMNFQLAYLC
jgi:hypothetical protein